jgi:hypothetical protein
MELVSLHKGIDIVRPYLILLGLSAAQVRALSSIIAWDGNGSVRTWGPGPLSGKFPLPLLETSTGK